MGSSNPRYECSSPTCNAKITRNQLKGSNGICIYCKTPMKHSSWMGGQQGTLSQLLTIPRQDEIKIKAISDSTGMSKAEIMSAAIQIQLNQWDLGEVDIEKTIKDGLMLAKLYRS